MEKKTGNANNIKLFTMKFLLFFESRKSKNKVIIWKLGELTISFLLENFAINNSIKLHFAHESNKILVFPISFKYNFLYEDFSSGNFCFIVLQQLDEILLINIFLY
jgi:hypothetical protein